MYSTWYRFLPEDVEVLGVQYPGRENRCRERSLDSIGAIAACCAEMLLWWEDRPRFFFGHSMGALVAFEVARELRRQGRPLPGMLVASGRRAPHIPEHRPPVSHLADEEFVAEVGRRYGGIPAEVTEDQELLSVTLPALRADFRCLETYAYSKERRMALPILVLGGQDDEETVPETLSAWERETERICTVQMFPGGHLFINHAGEDIVKLLGRVLPAYQGEVRC